MADQTQEAMRADFEAVHTELVFERGVHGNYMSARTQFKWEGWQAATAQSAEKIARLEAENMRLRDEKELRYVGRAIYEITCKQLAAAELSNKQLRDAIDEAAEATEYAATHPSMERWMKLLAQQPSTEALDAYVAKLTKWQPIETAPKDGAEIVVAYANQGFVKKLVWFDSLYGYWVSKGLAELGLEVNATHWMPLPPAPEKE